MTPAEFAELEVYDLLYGLDENREHVEQTAAPNFEGLLRSKHGNPNEVKPTSLNRRVRNGKESG